MIESFGDDATADLFHGRTTHRIRRFPPTLRQSTLHKLDMLNAAYSLNDLRVPPGNRLELLKGELSGYYSTRINEKWRIIFRWEDNNAREVAVIDYH